jgi:ATP-dependent exoDNAse (exonuclease V) beta subunit
MEMLGQQELSHWTVARIEALKPAMQHWLRQQGHAEQLANDAAATVQRILIQTLNSADGQWVLKTRIDAGVEFGITRRHQDVVKSYVIDRTFIEDGTRWIVDYKSVSLDSSLTDSELKIISAQYRAQLEDYAALFADEATPVKMAILFLSLGRLIVI